MSINNIFWNLVDIFSEMPILLAIPIGIIISIFCLFKSIKKKRLFRRINLDNAREEANRLEIEIKSILSYAVAKLEKAKQVSYQSLLAPVLLEEAAVLIDNARISVDDTLKLLEKVKKKKSYKKALKELQIARQTADKAKVTLAEARRKIETAKNEEREICHIRESIEKAAGEAKVTVERTKKDLSGKADAVYKTDIARANIRDARLALTNAEKALEEVNKWAADAGKAGLIQEITVAQSQVTEFAAAAAAEAKSAHGLIAAAVSEEKAYKQAEQDVSDINLASQKLLTDMTYSADKLKKKEDISPKIGEEVRKAELVLADMRKLVADIAECLSEIKVVSSAQKAQAIVKQAKELADSLKAKTPAVKLAVTTGLKIEAALQGTAQDKHELSRWFYDRSDREQYLYWLEKAAEDESADAQFELIKEKSDDKEKHYWLGKAASNGHVEAKVYMYANGDLADTGPKDIFEFCKKAADDCNNAVAMICVGELCCLGSGASRNVNSGAKYLLDGLRNCKEDLPAAFWLRIGKLFYEGKTDSNAKADLDNALPLFKKAADLGDSNAKKYLAETKKRIDEINAKRDEEERKRREKKKQERREEIKKEIPQIEKDISWKNKRIAQCYENLRSIHNMAFEAWQRAFNGFLAGGHQLATMEAERAKSMYNPQVQYAENEIEELEREERALRAELNKLQNELRTL